MLLCQALKISKYVLIKTISQYFPDGSFPLIKNIENKIIITTEGGKNNLQSKSCISKL